MSTRCEIYFTFDLKPDVPEDVLEAIRSMMDKNYKVTSTPAAEFTDNYWQGLLDISPTEMLAFPGSSFSTLAHAYRYTQMPNQGGQDVYRNTITFRAEIHGDAFGEDYVHLLMWIAQYTETQGFIGYFRYDHSPSHPTLLFFKNGKLDTQETFLPRADS